MKTIRRNRLKLFPPALLVLFWAVVPLAAPAQESVASTGKPQTRKEEAPEEQPPYLSLWKEQPVKAPLEDGVQRVFQFAYFRSFHDPLIVRIVERDREMTIRATRFHQPVEDGPIEIAQDSTRKLNSREQKAARSLFEPTDFFWTPLNDMESHPALDGLDGATWAFEIHDRVGYRHISIWSPRILARIPVARLKENHIDDSKLRNFLIYETVGKRLLEMGHILPADPREIY